MSGSYSRNKGNTAEREAVKALKRLGIEALTSRNARAGTQGDHDIICPDLPVALEVKDQVKMDLAGWVDQAVAQGDESAPGAVLHKRPRKAQAEDWYLTMRFEDFVRLVRPDLSF